MPRRLTKSGIMVGLGERVDEVLAVMDDLRQQDCDSLTIGQYLAPSSSHHPLVEYITPEQFDWYRDKAYQAGFAKVASGPLVRSSYKAGGIS
jgi:lipoyl synthase